MKRLFLVLISLIILLYLIFQISKTRNINPNYRVGQAIDSLNHVIVYYNGGVNHVEDRTVKAGYNIGLKYQCVEFVKRYYYEYLNHKMPDSYGHAKDFFIKHLKDGQINPQRNLIQFSNPSSSKPKVDDLLIFDATFFNSFGHVAIISKVHDNEIEIIQQNAGPFSASRVSYSLEKLDNEKWEIKGNSILGRLRKID